jgi:hypothetical protein
VPDRHLWEYDHPYYCGEATWYKVEDHHRWASWADFNEETIFATGDRHLNYLFRWDWLGPDPDDERPDQHELCLFFVMQRKGFLCSHSIVVTPDDEPAVRAWLEKCAATVRSTWEPFLSEVDA